MVWALWSAPVRVLLAQTHPEGPTSVGTAGAALCELLRVCEPEVGTPLAQVLSDSAIAARLLALAGRGCLSFTHRSKTYFEWHYKNVWRGVLRD